MASITSSPVHGKSTASNDVDPRISTWVTADNFLDIIGENEPGLKRIVNFDVNVTGGDGENYGSLMLRVKIKVELLYDVIKDFAFMLKTLPPSEKAQAIMNSMNIFPKEIAMYSKCLPEFEQMYREIGKHIIFGPKSYRFKKDPGVAYLLLEDLCPRGFRNENRLVGLDTERTESVLRLLAHFHAASAVRRETKGEYDAAISNPMFTEEQRTMLESMAKPMHDMFLDCLKKYKKSSKYVQRIKKILDSIVDQFIKYSIPDSNDFNVVTHGDLWVNNIMFRNNDESTLKETIFIDFQISRYGTPAMDLYYFLLSSTNFDIKLSQFDNFIKYYHDHLVENLKLLRYPKNFPTIKDLRVDLLQKSIFATSTLISVLPLLLLDPSSAANMDNFLGEGADGTAFKTKMFTNPRYVNQMELILPWMDVRGLLD